MVGNIGADIKGSVGESVLKTHQMSKGEGGSGNNIHDYTVKNTNAMEVRLRNEAKLQEAKSNINNMKAQGMQKQGDQNQQKGQANQTKGKIMVAAAAAMAATLFGAPAAAATAAAGTALITTGQGQQATGQGQLDQVPPSEQAATQHQGMADQKNAEADTAAMEESISGPDTPGLDNEEEVQEDSLGGLQGPDGDSLSGQTSESEGNLGSISEDKETFFGELGSSPDKLESTITEIEAGASPENLELYNEIFEGESPEDIALITDDFMHSEQAEGVTTDNYVDKFLDYALSPDDLDGSGLEAEGLEPASSDTNVDGTVSETNTVGNVAAEGVDPSLSEEELLTGTLADSKGTVSMEGLSDLKSSITGAKEKS